MRPATCRCRPICLGDPPISGERVRIRWAYHTQSVQFLIIICASVKNIGAWLAQIVETWGVSTHNDQFRSLLVELGESQFLSCRKRPTRFAVDQAGK
jgi:hypothetical protein